MLAVFIYHFQYSTATGGYFVHFLGGFFITLYDFKTLLACVRLGFNVKSHHLSFNRSMTPNVPSFRLRWKVKWTPNYDLTVQYRACPADGHPALQTYVYNVLQLYVWPLLKVFLRCCCYICVSERSQCLLPLSLSSRTSFWFEINTTEAAHSEK